MGNRVQRIILKAKPSKSHSTYSEWETASLCFLVFEDDRKKTIDFVKSKLSDENWELLYYELKDTLIHDRVVEVGGDFYEAYKTALKNGYTLKIFPDHFDPGKKKIRYLCPPPKFWILELASRGF